MMYNWTEIYNNRFQRLVEEIGDPSKAKSKIYEDTEGQKLAFNWELDEEGTPLRIINAYSTDAWCE